MTYRYFIKQICFFSISLLLSLSTACAQEPPSPIKTGDHIETHFKVPPKDGEYRKAWSSAFENIGCAKDDSTPDETYCLKLGSLQLGMEFYRLQINLSNIHKIPAEIANVRLVSKSPDGVRTVLIPIETFNSGGQLRMRSYLVALLDSTGKVNRLQMTGKSSEMTDNLAFSSIKLGSTKQWVTDILGLPSSVADAPQIKGKLWNYWPFPFSIELVNDVVYSMEIHSPSKEDSNKPFVPLNSVSD